MNKKLFALLSILVIISMALTACGGAQPAPAAATEAPAFAEATIENTPEPTATTYKLKCGVMEWETMGTCVESIANFDINGTTVLADISFDNDTRLASVNVEIVDEDGKLLENPTCYLDDKFIGGPSTNEELTKTNKVTERVDFYCPIGDYEIRGNLIIPVYSSLAMTLTSASTTTPTSTLQPRITPMHTTASSTPTRTPTPTRTTTSTITAVTSATFPPFYTPSVFYEWRTKNCESRTEGLNADVVAQEAEEIQCSEGESAGINYWVGNKYMTIIIARGKALATIIFYHDGELPDFCTFTYGKATTMIKQDEMTNEGIKIPATSGNATLACQDETYLVTIVSYKK